MGKPSMFSQSYENSMKKRRRNIIIIILLIIIVVVGGGIYLSRNLSFQDVRSKIKSIEGSLKEEENTGNKVEKTAEEIKNEDEVLKEEKEGSTEKEVANVPKEKNEYLGLGREVMLTVNYSEENGVKKILSVKPDERCVVDIFDNRIVVNILSSQNTYFIGEDFKVINITNPSYISSKKKEYTKEYVTEKYKDYVWCRDAKFIDKDNIVYVTNLPYIDNKKREFIWMYNIKDGKYIRFDSIEGLNGKNITFGKSDGTKISVNIDGKEFLIDNTGKITTP